MTLTRSQAKHIVDRVLSATKTNDVSVSVTASQTGNTRFATTQITTTGDVEELAIRVTVSVEGRASTVTGNRSDAKSIAELVERAEKLARIAPVDPEHMPPLPAQRYPNVDAYDAPTAKLEARERAAMVARVLNVARERQLDASGIVVHSRYATALGNKNGLFGFHQGTNASLETTLRTADATGSGKAGAVSHVASKLDARVVALAAADKAERSRNPSVVEAGKWVVVLEPQAVADLLQFLTRSLSARAADEGRSYFSKSGGGNRIGERLFHPSVTLRSDAGDRAHPSSPIGSEDLPNLPTTWIQNGVLERLAYSRFWAHTQGKPPLASPGSTHLSGTDRSLDDLIKTVDRALLVTRFWYNRMLEPRTILATGLTRDGTFLIEKGVVVRPVKNLRYNESPVTMLKQVLAAGQPQRAALGDGGDVVVVPSLVVEGFNFASVSDAV